MPAAGEDRISGQTAPSVVSVEDVDWNDARQHSFSFKRLFTFMGPGILMSIAYVDPGNLESDLQVGAQAGYTLLWLLLLSTAMGLVVQMQAAKLGVVTGQHLAQHCRQQYPRVPSIALWLMAEIAIIGSDVQEVIGSAIALALLSGGRLPLWAGVLLTAADSFALLFIERLGIRVLEGFFAGMVGVMVGTFGIMYSRAGVPLNEVVRGFTEPRLPRKDVPVAVALMGSLIMPHNIYLHSALVQTRRLGSSHPAAKREALTYFGIESTLSLIVAVVINLFITAVFAAGFYGADLPDIGLQNAGKYLGNTYGEAVAIIWALGLLAAGQSSTMTGTYTGQFVMSGYLDLKVSPWARVAITRAVAIAPTLVVALLCGGGDGTQLDQLNQGLNLLQSIQLPFALVPVLTFTSSRAIMGEFANSAATAAVCWAIAALVVLINGLAVYEVAYEAVVGDPWVSGVAIGVVALLYLGLVAYLALGPRSQLARWLGWSKDDYAAPGREEYDRVYDEVYFDGEGEGGPGAQERGGAGQGLVKAACGYCAGCRCWVAGGSGEGGEDVAGVEEEEEGEEEEVQRGASEAAVVVKAVGEEQGGAKANGIVIVIKGVKKPVVVVGGCGCRRGPARGSQQQQQQQAGLSGTAAVVRMANGKRSAPVAAAPAAANGCCGPCNGGSDVAVPAAEALAAEGDSRTPCCGNGVVGGGKEQGAKKAEAEANGGSAGARERQRPQRRHGRAAAPAPADGNELQQPLLAAEEEVEQQQQRGEEEEVRYLANGDHRV